jgi:hypothetical protein
MLHLFRQRRHFALRFGDNEITLLTVVERKTLCFSEEGEETKIR